MEIVIKISEKDYDDILNGETKASALNWSIFNAIRDGVALPKGHGMLIAEPTEEEIAKTIGGKNDFADCIRKAVKTVFVNAQPIIEADTEDKEQEEERE